MHLTKPALFAASLLWATAFASPINSPAILRTRGLIGGSTTDGSTKDIAGNTAAGNPVGDDNTKSISKSNAVEGAIDSFHLDDFAGSLTARDVSKRGHRRSSAPGSSSGSGSSSDPDSSRPSGPSIVTDAVCGASDTTQNDSSKDANEANDAKSDSGTLGDLMRRGIVGANAEGLTARDVSKRGHRRSSAPGSSSGSGSSRPSGSSSGVTDAVCDASDTTQNDSAKDANDGGPSDLSSRPPGSSGGPSDSSSISPGSSGIPPASSSGVTDLVGDNFDIVQNDSAKDAKDANDAKSDSGTLGDLMRRGIVGTNGAEKRFVARNNDGTVHDANKAVHDANKAVHNALHGLLHGILL
ncbi:hypothetical protein BCIN_08g05370 [Botrytis cinerea B05.10]|uniref:Uncharacterized protein n=1 Tax=Botryotinia fuckeliana (strain B05.10) TaxID=332648 RepID=A0A384JQX9_BOTFB|nr:hypothetical protein BCIN_08g05370 [Botrytis cinerea B05.10]ATZ52920.1 hypothetical protein BCIN_08g05370 [Botrytis cinerea B05.10]